MRGEALLARSFLFFACLIGLLHALAAPLFAAPAYEVSIEGALTEELETLLPEVSQLIALQERPVASRNGLERRIRRDLELIGKALQSKGYYGAELAWEIVEGEPPRVVIKVEPGERFTLASLAVEVPAGTDLHGVDPPSLAQLQTTLGGPAEATAVIEAERQMVDYFANRGFPFAEAGPRRVTVDLATQEMAATLLALPGPYATFGPLSVSGLDRLEEAYLREVIDWPEGTPFNAARFEDIRREVAATGLFESVALDKGGEVAADGSLPAALSVVEAPPRTVGVGLEYSTEEGGTADGVRFDAFWEHRNIFGEAETLRFELGLSLVRQRVAALFRKPNWLDDEQVLLLNAEFRREDSDAFRELGFLAFGGIERPLTENLTLTTGIGLELLRTDDLDDIDGSGAQDYLIGSLPTTLTYDGRDDIFNPTEGLFAVFTATPALATLARTTPYLLTDLSASTYWAPFEDDSVVLAARGRVAAILGSGGVEAIPASKRLYAGGGGSVRGYDVDSLGPLGSDDDPIGGRSLFEASLEARFRVYEDYGFVAFLDAGQVYADPYPTFSEPQFAAGVGLRYFTALGPVRLDVATPLNARDGDAAVQFYVSIGQSF